ncbi:MAG: glycosyltransferase [Oscillospiraceae bacterium]|nr:glycosyltransferase [Oscillospiraceae bacterium]
MLKVSIIVPVYNDEKYLKRCLQSLFNQTLKDIEIIAINDGSKDRSLEILYEFQKKYASKMVIVEQENGGAGSARNAGINIANGEFINFIDADDYLEQNALEKMFNIAKENNVKLVRCNYKSIIGPFKMRYSNNWGKLKGNQIVNIKKNKNYIITETPAITNKLISRDIFETLRFPEKIKWEDLAITPVIVASAQRIYHMDEALYNYRIHNNTTISDFIKKTSKISDILQCVELLKKHMRDRKLDIEYKKQIEAIYILHLLFRVENVMTWIGFPKKDKVIIINLIINAIELEYPNWLECKYIQEYKNVNIIFNHSMKKLDRYLDDRFRQEKEMQTINGKINEILK